MMIIDRLFKSPQNAIEKNKGSSTVSDEPVSNDLEENLTTILKSIGYPDDLILHRLEEKTRTVIAYLETLVDGDLLGRHVIEPLQRFFQKDADSLSGKSLESVLSVSSLDKVNTMHKAIERLMAGYALVLVENNDVIYALSLPGYPRRAIEDAPTEKVIKGPREGFNESLTDNISLVRRYIKDPNLRLEKKYIGERTKTEVAIVYLADVADPDIVNEVRKRMEQIEIDGVLESGYLAELIGDRRLTLFPLVQETERPDRVAAGILEGRVAVLVDRSSFNIIVPVTSNEFYQTSEDFYFNWFTASALRLIRAIGTIFAVTLPGFYISMISVNPELLPPSVVQLESSARVQTPLPAALEMLITFFAFEVLREASVRFPTNLNLVLGVGGGIVMGLAAINAGLVSGITVAIVVFCILSSFTTSNPAKEQAWRWVRYILFFAGAAFGIMGVIAVGVMVIAHMSG